MRANDCIGYTALFLSTENMYLAEFPDLPGCFSQGDTLEEALCHAQEALATYYAEKKGILPPASSLEVIRNANPNAIVQIVAIDTARYIAKPLRTVKKTLTVPEWLNDLAEKYHVNFSKVLRTALISYLNNLDAISPYDKSMLND